MDIFAVFKILRGGKHKIFIKYDVCHKFFIDVLFNLSKLHFISSLLRFLIKSGY